MKKIFLLAFIFSTCNSYSQQTVSKNKPTFYLDSIRFIALPIFDPNKIENVNVVKDNDPEAPYGKVYIRSKDPKGFNFLSAQGILKNNNMPIETISLFILDNEIIKDTANFKIDSSYIANIEIIKASEIEYLPHNIPSLSILKILTGKSENIIRIKGLAPTVH